MLDECLKLIRDYISEKLVEETDYTPNNMLISEVRIWGAFIHLKAITYDRVELAKNIFSEEFKKDINLEDYEIDIQQTILETLFRDMRLNPTTDLQIPQRISRLIGMED